MPAQKNLLLIFARNPEPGKVKTRLAADLGDDTALQIYKDLLRHTEKVSSAVNCDKAVFFTQKVSADPFFEGSEFRKEMQTGKDLGERMKNAFSEGFSKGYSKIIIIGTDLFELEQQDLETAFSKLEDHDYVIGPAEDGGYYLLGMKKLNQAIFSNKTWSTENVLSETLQDMKDEKVFLLKEKNDIDVFDDLKQIPDFEKYLKLP